ncbi:hypothetical protein [Blastococcus sp. TF02A-35]|uniref:hypothetical protein n=1 Tax=Blastococcus sp. TF02A-35 TaxID=2559612 RepID=UPI00107465AC|nr:hypothetical protein [Blastococcus sp. TF02A_35]TFV45743.1 hypothetical protein E4P43_17170 [Blastococcus sp. TF02A_35]
MPVHSRLLAVATAGVGDRGENEGEGAAAEAGGEVDEVERVAVRDPGGCLQTTGWPLSLHIGRGKT